MIRHTAAIVVALFVNPLPLLAQNVVFTVNATSAYVHKAPSVASPVIGYAPRGASLEVSRELGSWVKVVWPSAEDGVGYVHMSTGSIVRGSTGVQRRATEATPPRTNGAARAVPPPPPAAPSASAPPAAPAYAERSVAPPPRGYIRPPEHSFGLGARAGGPGFGLGVAARGWSRERVGLQVEFSRFTSDSDPGGIATIQLAPSVIYALPDHIFDYWWVRPYVGGGPSLQHRGSGVPGASDPLSGTKFGFQAFGGGEFTFASVPRFAVSVDVAYRWGTMEFAGIDFGRVGLSVAGRWYVK